MQQSDNTKRIAKNSIFLYFRLIITMGISLYTSRVVLNALGVEDYGVYNVVGGFVAIFTSLTNSLNIAFSRFMTIAIAKEDLCEQKKVFTVTVNMLLLASLIFILLSEIIGLWYFPNIINVPINRHPIVNQVFQLSLFAFIVSLGKTPCISLIIAHEKSSTYAFLGILDALLKLICVCMLAETDGDKLIEYCLLILFIDFISLTYTVLYCKYQFKCFGYVKNVPKHVYKEMFNFASWSFSGLTARVVNAQGLTLIINKYLGVVVNAAIGIITQIDGCTRQFVNNIGIAVDPQIIKSYATGNISYMRKLSLFSSKCFAFVVLLYAIPISFKADYILQIWLGFVPEYTSNLLRLVFCSTLFQVMANPLEIIANATGVISRFQFVTSLINIVTLPVVWILLCLGFEVYSIYAVVVLSYVIMLIAKFYLVKDIIKTSYYSLIPQHCYKYNFLST